VTTTFDLYLLRRFLHVFVILFVSTFGLFVVFDGFTNVDAFQQGRDGAVEVLSSAAGYYVYQSSLFFDLIGSMLAVVSVMVVFAILQRHSEIHPILAAGVPIYRLLAPVVAGVLLVSAVVVVNQELILPRIAHALQRPRGAAEAAWRTVEPGYDRRTHIHISGQELFVGEGRMTGAKFVLPARRIAGDLTTLKAREARFFEEGPHVPATGWLLTDVTPHYADLRLTPEGRKVVLPTAEPNELFIVTDVSFDQLYDRNRNYRYVSTPELVRRIRNPSFDVMSIRGQILHLHTRLTQPLLNVIGALAAVPLIVRRESRGLIGNMALCAAVQASFLGVIHAFLYLGQVNLVAPDAAVWVPVVVIGTLSVWLYGYVQT
jgi:lipopolysaccharide export system permease protein